MLAASSHFNTEKPSKYLKQMCKHFAHKVEVKFSDTQGEVKFPYGNALLKANDGKLEFEVEADNEQSLMICKSIIEKHMIKFAFREKLEKLDWSA